MGKLKLSPKEICREVGLHHLEWVEVMRRIQERVLSDDVEVITKTVGTFYRSVHKPRVRKLNGVLYNVPGKVVVALRGPRFPANELEIVDTGLRFDVDYNHISSPQSVREGQLTEETDTTFVVVDSSTASLLLSVRMEIRNIQEPIGIPEDGDACCEIRVTCTAERSDGFPLFENMNWGEGSVFAVTPLTTGWTDVTYQDGLARFSVSGDNLQSWTLTVLRSIRVDDAEEGV